MDGLFTLEDIANKDKVWVQCRACTKWTVQTIDLTHLPQDYLPCSNCSKDDYDPTSATSLRTYNPLNKRKVKK